MVNPGFLMLLGILSFFELLVGCYIYYVCGNRTEMFRYEIIMWLDEFAAHRLDFSFHLFEIDTKRFYSFRPYHENHLMMVYESVSIPRLFVLNCCKTLYNEVELSPKVTIILLMETFLVIRGT